MVYCFSFKLLVAAFIIWGASIGGTVALYANASLLNGFLTFTDIQDITPNVTTASIGYSYNATDGQSLETLKFGLWYNNIGGSHLTFLPSIRYSRSQNPNFTNYNVVLRTNYNLAQGFFLGLSCEFERHTQLPIDNEWYWGISAGNTFGIGGATATLTFQENLDKRNQWSASYLVAIGQTFTINQSNQLVVAYTGKFRSGYSYNDTMLTWQAPAVIAIGGPPALFFEHTETISGGVNSTQNQVGIQFAFQ